MSVTKKEPSKSKKGTNISKDKQKKVKILSKIIYIVARILKVCTVIVASFLLLAIVMTPVVIKNVKIEEDTISLFGNEIKYKYNEDKVDLLAGEYLIGSLTSDEKIDFDLMVRQLAKTDMTKSFAFIELALIAGVAVTFLWHFIFRYVDMLFINIYNQETPFVDENTDYLSKISYLALVAFIISLVSDIVSSLLFGNSMVRLNLSSAFLVVILYAITYIFEYACILQKDSKHKIYEA